MNSHPVPNPIYLVLLELTNLVQTPRAPIIAGPLIHWFCPSIPTTLNQSQLCFRSLIPQNAQIKP